MVSIIEWGGSNRRTCFGTRFVIFLVHSYGLGPTRCVIGGVGRLEEWSLRHGGGPPGVHTSFTVTAPVVGSFSRLILFPFDCIKRSVTRNKSGIVLAGLGRIGHRGVGPYRCQTHPQHFLRHSRHGRTAALSGSLAFAGSLSCEEVLAQPLQFHHSHCPLTRCHPCCP